MSWRNHLDHKSLIEGAGRHDVDTSCSNSHVALLSTMLENAISTYQHLTKMQVCENRQTSFVLTESGEDGLSEEEINDVENSENVESAKADMYNVADALMSARRNNFRTQVEEIAKKHSAANALKAMAIDEINKGDFNYPIEIAVMSSLRNDTIVSRVLEIIYESTKINTKNISPEFSTQSDLQNVIMTTIESGEMVTFNDSESLLAFIDQIGTVLDEIPSMLEKIEDAMEQTITKYGLVVQPTLDGTPDDIDTQNRITEIITTTLGVLVDSLMMSLTEQCAKMIIQVIKTVHPVIGAEPILPSNCDEEEIPNVEEVLGESASTISAIAVGYLSARIMSMKAMKFIKSRVNYVITDTAILGLLQDAMKMYTNRIALIQKELPKIAKAYSPLWTDPADILEIMKRNDAVGLETFILGRYDVGMLMQLIGNMTIADVDAIVKQMVINMTIPLKLKDGTYSAYITTTLVSDTGRIMLPDDFSAMVREPYGEWDAESVARHLQIVYTLEFDNCSRELYGGVASSPNITDRLKKLALAQNKLAVPNTTLALNESAALTEATYDTKLSRRIAMIKNLFKHGSLSLRGRKTFTQAELDDELTNGASVLVKEAQKLGLILQPKMEMLEPGLYNLGWIDMNNVTEPEKVASKLKYRLAILESKSEIFRYAIDYVVDTDAIWLDIYASHSENLVILAESAEIEPLDNMDEDDIYENPLLDDDDDSDDCDDDFENPLLDDDDDSDDCDDDFVNPLD